MYIRKLLINISTMYHKIGGRKNWEEEKKHFNVSQKFPNLNLHVDELHLAYELKK